MTQSLFKKIRKILDKEIVRNWSSLVLSMLVTTVSSFLCFAILGNKMSVDDYGLFNSMIALASTVAVFVNNVMAGIVANREIALKPQISRNILRKFIAIRVVAFGVGVTAMYLYAKDQEHVTELVFFGLIVLLSFDAFWDLFEQIAFGLKITKYSMVLNIASSIVWLAVVLLIPKCLASTGVILAIYAAICAAKTAVYGILDFRLTKPYIGQSQSLPFRYLLMSSLPYLYNRLLGTLSTQVPVLLLDGYAGLAETAYYSAGEKFATPVTKLATVTVSAVFPFLTRALKKDHKSTGMVVVNLFRLLLTFGSCGCLLLCATSDLWLVGVLGQKYANAVEAFNYQIWFAVAVSVDSFFSMLLSSDFRQKTLSVVTTVDAVLLLPFLYFGIPYGAKGVAMMKLAHAMITLLYHLAIVSKIFCGKIVYFPMVLSWAMFFSLACFSSFSVSRILQLVVCAVSITVSVLLNVPTIKEILSVIMNRTPSANEAP